MTFASVCGMRFRTSAALLLAASLVRAAEPPAPRGWDRLLSSVGLDRLSGTPRFTLLEGDSSVARELGFRAGSQTVRVAALEELRDTRLEVLWEKPLDLPVFELPQDARVFTREKRTAAPLVAGLRRGERAILWTAAAIGEQGYERFPYLLQSLADLGVEFPFRGARTWAFFDYSYRMRADPDFLARNWRAAGISALHVAAWHFHEPDPGRDQYLRTLLEACHRQGVLVYAWLGLPHVSEQFWQDHPHWREKTAILQDAHLDWRKLMNLADPECARAAEAGLAALLRRFDWDGVNLAELYFESLYGPSDPQRFTPMNDVVRREFRARAGFDPLDLFQPESPRHWQRAPEAWRRFVDFRAGLARRLQEHWLAKAASWRPGLDLVLTHIDDRFDTRMREYLAADASAVLPLLERFHFTFAIEDPATAWHLGPERYPEIARRYAALTSRRDRLAVDINIVERYQDVYPTKKQTGGELAQLLQLATRSFARVMLYFEQSIARADYDLVPAASAAVRRTAPGPGGRGRWVEAAHTAGVRWKGPVRLNGKPWPATDGETAWVPAGRHLLENGAHSVPLPLLWLNAELLDARSLESGLELVYAASSRAAALVPVRPLTIELDGRQVEATILDAGSHFTVLLPPGRHRARLLLSKRW
jgi:hypothetical protein